MKVQKKTKQPNRVCQPEKVLKIFIIENIRKERCHLFFVRLKFFVSLS